MVLSVAAATVVMATAAVPAIADTNNYNDDQGNSPYNNNYGPYNNNYDPYNNNGPYNNNYDPYNNYGPYNNNYDPYNNNYGMTSNNDYGLFGPCGLFGDYDSYTGACYDTFGS
jgi:hypothetical protein